MRLYVRSRDRRPDPEPLPTDDRAAVLVGTAVWAVLQVAALLFLGDLRDDGRGWWVWTPLCGMLLGAYGLHYLRGREQRGPR